jgi:hypothetical protein
MSSRRPASPGPLPSLPRKRGRVRVGWADGAAGFVHDPCLALHDLSRRPAKAGAPGASERRGPGALGSRFRGNDEINARAIGDGLGRASRMGGEEPGCRLQDADHRRVCAELPDDRLPVLQAAPPFRPPCSCAISTREIAIFAWYMLSVRPSNRARTTQWRFLYRSNAYAF